MARRPPRASASSSNSGPRLAAGAATGIGIWIVGYLVAFILWMIESVNAFGTVNLGSATTWKVVGWILHGAHFVSVSVGPRSANVVTEAGGIYLVMVAVVPLLLFLAGVMLGSGGYGAAAGASVAVGYLPLSLAGSFLFEVNFLTVGIGPDPLFSILIMGIGYPVLFGGLGGAIAPS
jgi:hypothetical protein